MACLEGIGVVCESSRGSICTIPLFGIELKSIGVGEGENHLSIEAHCMQPAKSNVHHGDEGYKMAIDEKNCEEKVAGHPEMLP